MRMSDNLDIISYWKTNQCRYPILAVIARDILSIHVSTVTSEVAFSVWGRVLDQFRGSLKHDIVEAIICSRDWLFKGEDKFSQILYYYLALLNYLIIINHFSIFLI